MKKQIILLSLLLLSLTAFAQTEICNNGIDDDNDGYIDMFDPDCPCSDSAYQAFCEINCKYIPDSFPEFSMKIKWETEFFRSSPNSLADITSTVAGDIDGDGKVEVGV